MQATNEAQTTSATTTTGPGRSTWRRHVASTAWPTLLLAVSTLGAVAAVSTLAVLGIIPLWAGTVINVVLAYVAFTPMHDASHASIVPGHPRLQWVHELVGWVSGAVLLAPYPAFKMLHARHHAFTNDPDNDPDFWVAGTGPLSIALRCATIMVHYYRMLFGNQTRRTPSMRKVFFQSVAGLGTFAGVAILLVVAGAGLEMVALWLVPALVAHGFLALVFDYVPHRPHTVQGRFRDTSVILFPGLNVLMLGQNYHLVHHLYPRIPFYRYGTAFFAMRAELERQGAPIVDLRERGRALLRPVRQD